ncbi:MAG TPA: M18 family aminopeptidase [Candidatus Avipropionibacterium avicola]|uniref:M18 family aminopeptidase n=1 Tax=Candidatus Avipropionibacterium avicola TaxID=2840701 RepID=A0A9D1H0W5_9ACTN|nr:M18 family aminopeptidase [Candidatus Avipropionibacterium avicola]
MSAIVTRPIRALHPSSAVRGHVDDLIDFVAASPSSFHAAAEGARRLEEAGFRRQDEAEPFDASPGGHYLVRDGALLAWRIPQEVVGDGRFSILGAHTDSPAFKLKPAPSVTTAGWSGLGVEVYGGPLLNSWLDRELGLAGRLVTADGTEHLVRTGPIMRIPQLAIHLDRGVNDKGVQLDKQGQTMPVWGLDPEADIMAHLAGLADIDPGSVLGYDVVSFDTARGAVFGPDDEFLACGRLDNLSSVHAGLTALIEATDTEAITVLAGFDHEEVGSGSRSGAGGPVLADVLSGIAAGLGRDADGLRRMLSASVCLSADAGHAVHPNYVGHHDPVNQPLPNRGTLLKLNANQRYATDAVGTALWRTACDRAQVPTQDFVSNNALPCGSTIGPITATRLGITTIDVGIALLSMHSARELAGADDPYSLARAATAFLTL